MGSGVSTLTLSTARLKSRLRQRALVCNRDVCYAHDGLLLAELLCGSADDMDSAIDEESFKRLACGNLRLQLDDKTCTDAYARLGGAGAISPRSMCAFFELELPPDSSKISLRSRVEQALWERRAPSGGELTAAVNAGDDDELRLLLSRPRVDPNRMDSHREDPALTTAAWNNNLSAVELLLEHPATNVNLQGSEGNGMTPLFVASWCGNDAVVRRLLEQPSIELNLAAANDGSTPLFRAVYAERVTTTRLLLNAGADPNARWQGRSPLEVASDAHHHELTAILLKHPRIDAGVLYTPFAEACLRGSAARARLLSRDGAAQPPPLVGAVLDGPGAAAKIRRMLADVGGASATSLDAAGLPALYYAIELGESELVPLLAAGFDDAVKAEAIATASSSLSSGGEGTRYFAFILAIVAKGLEGTTGCKQLILSYLKSMASHLYFDKSPDAFRRLKVAFGARLEQITVPLEAIWRDERLGERLGALGAEIAEHASLRLDEPGIFPVLECYTSESDVYEEYFIYSIWLASLALNAEFVRRLTQACARFGDGVSIKAAPIKRPARMQNKLKDDHSTKRRPRPAHNVDAARAAVVVKDAALLGEVYASVAQCGEYLRVKNNYSAKFDAPRESYGYRALLGNLHFVSGVSCGECFRDNACRAARCAHTTSIYAWSELLDSLPDCSEKNSLTPVLAAFRADALADAPLDSVVEVQIIYEPYLTLGRKKSHLPYKVVRCENALELLKDAQAAFPISAERKAAEMKCASVISRRQQQQQ